MTNEQKALLRLLNSSVNGTKPDLSDIDAIDWISLVKEAEFQTVSTMTFDVTETVKERIPPEAYKAWSNRAVNCLISNSKVEASQRELVKLLEGNGYPYVILKGEASAQYYPKPELRALGDVDFLIESTQEEDIKKLLCENGYKSEMEDHICHIVFKKPNSHLEMHREIPGIPNGQTGDKIRRFMQGAMSNFETKGTHPDVFKVPNDCHHGLILLLHTQHHLVGEGIGLRHLCDWAVFVKQTQDKPFWEELVSFFKEIGLMTFASTLTKVCAIAFGINCPKWAENADDALCVQLLEDVFSGGNFGRKEKRRLLSGALITDRGKDGFEQNKYKRMVIVLKDSIKSKYPSVEKYPILYPFLFVWKIVRYLGMWIVGKRPSPVRLSATVDKRKSIYKQLQIFEVEEK